MVDAAKAYLKSLQDAGKEITHAELEVVAQLMGTSTSAAAPAPAQPVPLVHTIPDGPAPERCCEPVHPLQCDWALMRQQMEYKMLMDEAWRRGEMCLLDPPPLCYPYDCMD